jgi:response regulator RpfG family c-di-GMP phosphodiesterase
MAERILIVDAEEEIRRRIISMLSSPVDDCVEVADDSSLKSLLAPVNYDYREAGDGLEAMRILGSGETFDLVLADLVLPSLDGMRLLEYIKGFYPDIEVVIVTARHEIQVALHALRNGACDYLLKPFERNQLVATVRRALEHRRLKRETDAYRTNLEALVAARTQQWKTTLSDLEKAYDIALEGFGDALALRDAETEAHSKRVTAYTIAIARKMGLPKEEIKVIARGAFVHDIGKLAIPDSILLKPGPLTADETETMRQYVYHGFKIISRIPFLADAAEIVYSHQERYDGSGYPRGLKGEQIPLGARLVAVANTLDAITSDRPYRRAQTFEAARKEIEPWLWGQFDPRIVKVFLEIPNEKWVELKKSTDNGMRFQ